MERTDCLAELRELGVAVDVAWIVSVRRRLVRWGRVHYRDYPWRSVDEPWLALVAEFMLQRTRAAQVEPIFREVAARYGTPNKLARSGTRARHSITQHLGLHSRGAKLIAVAREVSAHGGEVPRTMAELTALGGIGQYTAAAILSLHMGERAVMIDSNVVRWLSRMTGMPYNRDPRGVRWVTLLGELLTPARAFRDYNYAVLDFTMTVCTTGNPACSKCMFRRDCGHAQQG